VKKSIIRWRDKNGRFTKFDGRKLLRCEVESSTGKRSLSDRQVGRFYDQKEKDKLIEKAKNDGFELIYNKKTS